jgi:hypothetical protein
MLFHQYQEHNNHLNEDELRDEQEQPINRQKKTTITNLHLFFF